MTEKMQADIDYKKMAETYIKAELHFIRLKIEEHEKSMATAAEVLRDVIWGSTLTPACEPTTEPFHAPSVEFLSRIPFPID